MQHRITINLHGGKSGTAPSAFPVKHARGDVSGWTPKSARGNTEFLQSVEYGGLSGLGLAFTGTIKECPETPDDWHKMRLAFIHRLRRLGLLRFHWVTEWQRRGVPHLHGMFFFPVVSGSDYIGLVTAIRSAWLALAEPYGGLSRGVHIVPMTDARGWAEYEAKHASRGCNHYQRSKDNIPEKWQSKTGRVWGKGGDWPTQNAMTFATSGPVFNRFRRLIRSWRIAEARASGKPRRIAYARKSLKCNHAKYSAVRGTNDWIPNTTTMALLHASAVLTSGTVDQIR